MAAYKTKNNEAKDNATRKKQEDQAGALSILSEGVGHERRHEEEHPIQAGEGQVVEQYPARI